MDILLANVSGLQFKAERDLIEQVGAIPLPFYGMDKSIAAVCNFITRSGQECDKGSACPFRHIRGDRTIVCKHWLRGLCKKGDQCEFLHEYDMTKMPECYFYSRFNACHNKECPFLHIDPQSKVKDCPWYKRGFCRHGPHCRHQHLRRVLCMDYLAGFCPEGPACKHMHPHFELPPLAELSKDQLHKKLPTCHYCGELGHKANSCKQYVGSLEHRNNINAMDHSGGGHSGYSGGHSGHSEGNDNDNSNPNNSHHSQHGPHGQHGGPGGGGGGFVKVPTPLEEITCYKCGHKGHYANKCPKGHLAFLSNQHSHK
ncbi:cleavage and polyadenylation specificity factor subunit 4 [Drosophila gunungcola]|uniref:cleavage and polyadenylation specificity factor subunit 4 n=1 Tax=Drosophila gunungcola TaxID=103775 RepID=UPI0022E1F1BB|nr:cleavage and polyadenylation specificity factor subunit 4 [Drosophila gunungcola]